MHERAKESATDRRQSGEGLQPGCRNAGRRCDVYALSATVAAWEDSMHARFPVLLTLLLIGGCGGPSMTTGSPAGSPPPGDLV